MNENIDLTKILKDCPEGEKFWSKVHGEVTFCKIITEELGVGYPIETRDCSSWLRHFTEGGKINEQHQGECILVPSKDQQDWRKFSAPWYKNEKFDPNTLQPFDKILVRDEKNQRWKCSFFSHIYKDAIYPYITTNLGYKFCIPYNDDTKHLVGTTEEAPEYYRYWED